MRTTTGFYCRAIVGIGIASLLSCSQPIAKKDDLKNAPMRNHQRYDPIEDDRAIAPLIAKAEQEAMESPEYKDYGRGRGRCHVLWRVQKQILREKYDVRWRTPAEMNPDIIFD